MKQGFDIIEIESDDRQKLSETIEKVKESKNIISLGFQVVRGVPNNKIYVFVVYKA